MKRDKIYNPRMRNADIFTENNQGRILIQIILFLSNPVYDVPPTYFRRHPDQYTGANNINHRFNGNGTWKVTISFID